MSRKSKHDRAPGYTRERAEFWRVSVRVMQLWLRRDLPVDSVEKMISWYAGLSSSRQSRLSASFRARVTELRLRAAANAGKKNSSSADPEWADFERHYSANSPGDQTELAELKKLAAFYRHKMLLCSQRSDHAGASAAQNLHKDIASVIHDMELRAQKLGRDLGDLVPRSLMETTARHIGYHLLRCADSCLSELVRVLTVTDPAAAPLLPEEIRARVEPVLLNSHVLQPIRAAARAANPAAPPPWLVASLEAGLAEVLEEIQLDRTPVPIIPAP